MSAVPTTPRPGLPSKLLRVLILLAISVFINYIDRGNLSIAAPMIKDELGLSASQLGILLSAFFWTYASFQLISGWLVDRFNVNWVMAAGFFLWSVATAATGTVHAFYVLFAVRLILGMGESVAYPSYSKILAQHFPEEHRGFANSLIAAGLVSGPGFGMLMGGMLMARFGWRSFFLGVGIVSLLWLVPWLRWMPKQPSIIRLEQIEALSVAQFARLRSAWGTCAGLFCSNYLSYFLITWLPFYLVRERHYSLPGMAKIGGAAYLLAALASTLSGWLSDRWISRGGTPTLVRKLFTGGGLAGAGIALAVCGLGGRSLSLAMLMLVTIGFGICSSNIWAITQTLAGPQAAGRWTGMQNFVGNLAGVAAPAITGFVLDRTGNFIWPFALATTVALLGAAAWFFLLGPVEQVAWEAREDGLGLVESGSLAPEE